MTAASVTPATDLFERVSIGAKLFRIWLDIVSLWLERRRNPLSATADLYPIVNRHYKPVAGAKSPPNPSYHLTSLKKQGLLADFAAQGASGAAVLEPMTDKVVMVGGRVVYAPDMLERIRELDAETLLHEGVGEVEVQSALATSTVPKHDSLAQDVGPRDPEVAHGEPVVVGAKLARYYEAVMATARTNGYRPLRSVELNSVHHGVNPQAKNPAGITYELETHGFLRMVSGKKMSGTAMRVVVFRGYRIRHSYTNVSDLIDPPELDAHRALEGEESGEPTREQMAAPPMPKPEAAPTGEPSPASTGSDLLAKVRERRAALEQAERDLLELEGEEAEHARLLAERAQLDERINEISFSIEARRSRLAQLDLTK